MQLGGQNKFHLLAIRLNKLMIIFYMNIINIIFQYFSITLFKNDFATNNSKKITPMYTLCQKKISNLRLP
jgi:hypothetical protein